MRYYRAALIMGIIGALMMVAGFTYYLHTAREVRYNRTKLEAILQAGAQRREYVRKIESIRASSSKLITICRDRGTTVDYEITLTDHDLKKLFSEVSSTYAADMFFLEKATVESTSSGISVSMKGFKLGGGDS
jgi:hypothetical protein